MKRAEVQQCFADHLRDPEAHSPPGEVEARRMAIYRSLVYNNIESFIRGGFPVLRSLYADEAWHRLVRAFIAGHRCQTPYFLEIGQEFLSFLQNDHAHDNGDPPFITELAHYEWVELALDVADTDLEAVTVERAGDLLDGVPVVSPLAWRLSYQYPVHRISREFRPEQPAEQPVFLLVWRSRDDEVRFMEANAVTFRLLQLLESDPAPTGRAALFQLATEMQHPDPQALETQGVQLLEQLRQKDVILGCRVAGNA